MDVVSTDRYFKSVVPSSLTWLGRTIVVAYAWYGRRENSMDVARTQWQRSESVEQPFSCHVRNTSMKLPLRLAYTSTTSMPLLPRPYTVITASLFGHVLITVF